MTPIRKKEKHQKKVTSYRPISPTSCIAKTIEQIINKRLLWHLEGNNLLAREQARFRQFQSTEDQTTYLSQEVEDAFQQQKMVYAAWIDLQKAFDRVWTDGLIVKNGIIGNMFKWIKSFLHNRRARVNVDNYNSRNSYLNMVFPKEAYLSSPFSHLHK